MFDHPLLARLVLGYSAVIDRQRSVVATRLTLAPADSGGAGFDGAELVDLLGQAWPEAAGALSLRMRPLEGGGGAKATAGLSLLLNAAGESLLQALLAAPATPRFAIEVPAFMTAEAGVAAAVQALAEGGGTLALKGLPREPLPAALASCFALQAEDGDAPAPKGGSAPRVRLGIRSARELEAAFGAGCVLAAGWPFGDAPPPSATKKAVAPELQVILELINRVDREEPVERLEAVLKNDPTLAFRLIRYINSPGFGLSVEIGSFRHALMILGYQKLKRWLALLLASASKDANMKPVMFAAVRRGLFLEELVKAGGDAELRGELFICGVFSLLDRLLAQPFAELLRSVPVSEKVRQALLGEEGPFLPYLELVQAIEQESVIDVREKAERLMLSVGEVNRALLAALTTASQLE
ncbi:MAG TPA: HDOD domain-containing protein [Rubrivivax sp.]|nr:HDOD domain-containing protein [Rubrivivax sp.]